MNNKTIKTAKDQNHCDASCRVSKHGRWWRRTNCMVFAAILALPAIPLATEASARQDARRMTCNQVHQLIKRRGAVVLTTGRHTYERYVIGSGLCNRAEVARTKRIQTRDTRRCPVRMCEDASIYYPSPIWD